ncbi:putative tagatose-6-phosphate ketose/aldose isomerase [Pseudovibrio axinellae]|uniref:Putative tagatose-6-phosphate ketose/aldose isomerase n=1 Tax=Pseudovibrio axinellae TaxID=989403 RepID=A0A165T4Z1_9HYPH|nr:SIS domain-containing protein [Pseudovibrio axinellae]KZL05437.1 putative tagatose-6-phosphate ketose/aldose isomerase [Pseudovibrio axinellae]SEP99252.1 galactosamine 6-phosphate isomerase AgaS [Pseudovibrio axinellae]
MVDLTKWATTREIQAQREIWTNWGNHLSNSIEELREWVMASGATQVWFCGAGTSAYIGDVVSRALDATSVLPLRSVPSTDLVSAPQAFQRKGVVPLVVSFGRSGNSTESIGTLDLLDAVFQNAPRLNITCNKDSALATRKPASGAAQKTIILPEQCHDSGFAMTSSFTTMVLTALCVFGQENPEKIAKNMEELGQAAEMVIAASDHLAQQLTAPQRAVFVGSGPLMFVARESALKVMELAAGQIPAIWESSLGFRHGPKSFVTAGTKVFLFISNNPHSRKYDLDLAAEIKAQFGKDTLLTIGNTNDADIRIPCLLDDGWTSVLNVLVAQWLGIFWAEELGLNVDNPFEGQGTLTRVVSGVKLYALEEV